MSMQSGPLDPESLTELALRCADERAKQLCDEETLAEYEALTTFVSACREASLAEGSSAEGHEPSLATRALSAARSEDLSWRGDLQLLQGFIRDGLRSSALLRLAAASVLVHLAALPVVAFFVLTEEPAVPEFRVEVGKRELPYAVSEESEQQRLNPVELDDPRGLDALLVENTLRWSRWQLSRTSDPRVGAGLESPPWLDLRSGVLWGGSPLSSTTSTPSVFVEAELALDALLVSGGTRSSGDEALKSLKPLHDLVGVSSDPGTWLALSALARAESYGILNGEGERVLRMARTSMPAEHRFRALIEVEGDLRRRLPLDPLWAEAFFELSPDGDSSAWVERLRQNGELGGR